MKDILQQLIPPLFLNLYRSIKNHKYGWKGNYINWNEANIKSSGYDTKNILDKVRSSLLKVKKGEAVYERDSVIFDEIQYSWPILSMLMFCALKSGGRLDIIDFGGSLGSTYFQNKKFLDQLNLSSWSIVEQSHFVEVGKIDFEDDKLKFFNSIEDCSKNNTPNIILFSSVLQYIEDPFELLDSVLKHDFDFILIDRTPFSRGKETIKLQIVPSNIYKASYPCRFFDKVLFLNYFEINGYVAFEQFPALDGESNEFEFKGLILINRKILNA
jgi:putative methyltransferase (TIGR04325 family)